MKIGDRFYLTEENFFKICAEIEARGGERITIEDVKASVKDTNFIPFLQKKHRGMERGYRFRYKRKDGRQKQLFVWVTWVDAIRDINDEDLIWIGIEDEGSKIIFYLFPIKRTLHFVQNTLDHVDMGIEFMHTWPCCPECGQQLRLVFVSGIPHLMKFVCSNSAFVHSLEFRKKFYPIFDIPISDERHEILYNDFKRSLEYLHKNSLKDNPSKVARFERARRKQLALLQSQKKNNQYGDIKTYQEGIDGPHNDGDYGG